MVHMTESTRTVASSLLVPTLSLAPFSFFSPSKIPENDLDLSGSPIVEHFKGCIPPVAYLRYHKGGKFSLATSESTKGANSRKLYMCSFFPMT